MFMCCIVGDRISPRFSQICYFRCAPAQIFRQNRRNSGKIHIFVHFSQICAEAQRKQQICEKMNKNVGKCRKVEKSVKNCQKCRKMSESVKNRQKCRKMSGGTRLVRKMRKVMLDNTTYVGSNTEAWIFESQKESLSLPSLPTAAAPQQTNKQTNKQNLGCKNIGNSLVKSDQCG